MRPEMNKDHQSLHISIIGGGLAGFSAAIALRRNGHEVEIFEQSRFANEIGAAIHMTPNATGILKQIGVDPRESGAVPLIETRLFTADNKPISVLVTEAHRWQHPWLQAHRAHLHSQLKTTATSASGRGRPVEVHVSSRVVSVDSSTATIYFEDGSTRSADVLVGADGVHSMTRKAIAPNAPGPFKTNHSAFRFVIDRQLVLDDPETALLASADGTMDMWYSADQKIVLYPTSNNKLLNFVCIHPSSRSETRTDDYSTSGSKSKLLDVYKGFHPSLVKLLSKADAAELKIYPLYDMENLPTYVKGRLALIGDSAHPFTPHLAQGGAQALEDALSLSVFLEQGLSPREVPERLELYNKARYKRSSKIQELSRVVGGDKLAGEHEEANTLSVSELIDYGFSHDEIHASSQLLREHKWKRQPLRFRQPTVFGPAPGPRQDHYGKSHASTLQRSTTTKRVVRFKTSATLLRNLFPNANYSFTRTDTVAIASYSVETLSNMAWLSGGGYNLLGLYIHGVSVKNNQGEVRKGVYCPLMLENLADPIITGREELGVPKLYSDIDIEESEKSSSVKISWRGSTYAELSFQNLGKPGKEDNSFAGKQESEGLLLHKYMPSHEIGKAICEQDVLLLDDTTRKSSIKSQRLSASEDTVLKIKDLGVERLPTLHHIVSRLAELPILEVLGGSVTEYQGVTDLSAVEVLNDMRFEPAL